MTRFFFLPLNNRLKNILPALKSIIDINAFHLLSGALLSLFHFNANAIVPPEYNNGRNPLISEFEFGFVYNKTNTTNSAVNSRLKFDYESTPWTGGNTLGQLITLRHYYSRDDGETSTHKYQLEYQANYDLSSKDSLFARAEAVHDKFASYIDQQTLSGGYSYKFYDFTKRKLRFEIGPGYRHSKPNNNGSDASNATATYEPIIRSAALWEQRFTTNLKASSDIAYEWGITNSITSINGRIENYLLGNLALVFELRFKHTRVVPENTVNREIFSNLNLLFTL